MRVCPNCGAVDNGETYKRCLCCGFEYSFENNAPGSDEEIWYSQLVFFDTTPDVSHSGVLTPLSILHDTQQNPAGNWPPQTIPNPCIDMDEYRRSKKLTANAKPKKKAARRKKTLTREQQLYRNAIVLAVILGWSGLHRKYIGDDESFKAYLLFGIVGGLLTGGVTTVFAELIALCDAFLLLTGRVEVNLIPAPRERRKLETVFSTNR